MKVKHLYARAGFGLKPQAYAQIVNKPLKQVVNTLFQSAKQKDYLKVNQNITALSKKNKAKIGKKERKALRKKSRQLVLQLNANWVKQMTNSNNPLMERMTLFWHWHFACTTKNIKHAIAQNQSLRNHALGNFRDLLIAISKDPAMIMYLNNQQNKKRKPNENYARELLELFTLGRGNYTEKDIREAARAFTGWSTKSNNFIFKKKQHDFGSKTFLGETGNFDGTDIIEIILSKKETAIFIAKKVYRYFVSERINLKHIKELADIFYDSNYNIEIMMRHLFLANWFYDPVNIGSKIKSPIDLLVGLMKQLDISVKVDKTILFIERALGQVIFAPPNVAGWQIGRSWIDNSTLLLRMNLAAVILQKNSLDFKAKSGPEALIKAQRIKKIKVDFNTNPILSMVKEKNLEDSLKYYKSYLLAKDFPIKHKAFLQYAQTINNPTLTIIVLLLSLPEYQMT